MKDKVFGSEDIVTLSMMRINVPFLDAQRPTWKSLNLEQFRSEYFMSRLKHGPVLRTDDLDWKPIHMHLSLNILWLSCLAAMKLYAVCDGPPSLACRMTLKHLKVPFELVEVNFNVGEHLTEDYAKVSWADQIPDTVHQSSNLSSIHNERFPFWTTTVSFWASTSPSCSTSATSTRPTRRPIPKIQRSAH